MYLFHHRTIQNILCYPKIFLSFAHLNFSTFSIKLNSTCFSCRCGRHLKWPRLIMPISAQRASTLGYASSSPLGQLFACVGKERTLSSKEDKCSVRLNPLPPCLAASAATSASTSDETSGKPPTLSHFEIFKSSCCERNQPTTTMNCFV